MDGGNGKWWLAIILVVVAIAVVVVVGVMQRNPPANVATTPGAIITPKATTPVSTTSTSATATAAAKAPKDYLPTAVAGFDLAGQNPAVTPNLTGETARSVIYFKPSANSQFANKIGNLTFYVHQFKDAASATSMAGDLAKQGTTRDWDTANIKAKLVYDKTNKRTVMYTQLGTIIAYCFADAPAGGTVDEASQQAAVVLGFAAIKF